MNASNHRYNKNILIAVDTSENARRAVCYVAQLLEGNAAFTITLMHVINEPEEDYFSSPTEQAKWVREYRQKNDAVMNDYEQILIQAGFASSAIFKNVFTRFCPSLAECILTEQNKLAYDTVVVGRQGLSRSEEFLFGSVSSKIVTHAKNCTVWVVS